MASISISVASLKCQWLPSYSGCLAVPFFLLVFCVVASVPVPFILLTGSKVGARCVDSSHSWFQQFLRHFRASAVLRLPVLLFRLFLSGADGCLHTVVVLQFLLLLMLTAADLFFAPTCCLMVIPSLEELLAD